MVFCCFGCVLKQVSGCCFLALLLEAASSKSKLEIKIGQNWISSRISEGTFRPPGNLLLRLILRHVRHEIRWCFAVFLAAGFLLYYRQQQQSKLEIKIGQNWISSRISEGAVFGLRGKRFQKGRFGLRGTCYCDGLCVIFGTKLGGVLLLSAVFRSRCVALLSCLYYRQQQQSKLEIKIGHNWFPVGFLPEN